MLRALRCARQILPSRALHRVTGVHVKHPYGRSFCTAEDSEYPPTVVIEPRRGAPYQGTLVFLHGLGDSADGWADVFSEHGPPGLRLVLPNAHSQPVTMNRGSHTTSWYDLLGLADRTEEPCEGLEESSKRVSHLVIEELSRPNSKVILGGFSQGGSLALYSALIDENIHSRISGVIGLSCDLPRSNKLPTTWNGITPVFMGHGDSDPVVPHDWGQLAHTDLIKLGATDIEFHLYEFLAHGGSFKELIDIGEWVDRILPIDEPDRSSS